MANLPYRARALIWIGDSKDELSSFPLAVKRIFGFALRLVQNGEMLEIAKPLTGLGPGVYELKDNADRQTFRVVYVVKLKKGVYVVDAFVKKSKRGSKTPKDVKERLEKRIAFARQADEE